MTKKVKLAEAEWKIMLLLWKKAPLSCRQLEDLLKAETGWTRHTIISFLKRMLAKEAIRVEKASPAKLYYPLLDRNEVVLDETRSFIAKLFDGRLGLMASLLVENDDISDEEINEMLSILQKARSKGREGGEV